MPMLKCALHMFIYWLTQLNSKHIMNSFHIISNYILFGLHEISISMLQILAIFVLRCDFGRIYPIKKPITFANLSQNKRHLHIWIFIQYELDGVLINRRLKSVGIYIISYRKNMFINTQFETRTGDYISKQIDCRINSK